MEEKPDANRKYDISILKKKKEIFKDISWYSVYYVCSQMLLSIVK